jgi:3-phosphoshikimate 1-carboxyvinyltransferase
MGLAGGYPLQATFTGDGSLTKRPMGRVIKPLSEMGIKFESAAGDKLPLKVIGSAELKHIAYILPVASAQVKSAILLAGLHARGKTVVVEPSPTRDHTERMLRFLGADIRSEMDADGSNVITLTGFPHLTARDFTVPSDPSSAAFLTVAALITKDSDVVIPNVSINPLRTGLYDTLKEMGGNISFQNQREASGEPVADIRVRSSELRGVAVPPERVPSMIDEFPILSVAASFATGNTYMTDLSELRVKESDRLAAIANGLKRCGVSVDMGEDTLTVHGKGSAPEGGCKIYAHLDHRIAMSFLIMGLAAQMPVIIDDAETIGTSFPGFADLMNSLGAKISAAEG